MCGRVIQSSGPIRYGIVEGIDVPDNRVHNYAPRFAHLVRRGSGHQLIPEAWEQTL